MSTVAPTKVAAGGGGYEVSRPQGQCAICQKKIEPDEKFMAALAETPQGFARAEWCLECWPKHEEKDLVAFWQTVMPHAEAKKKVFVDDAVLCELFERLSEVSEPAKVNFRFVLGLILMRKRLVIYEETRNEEGRELWRVRMKGKQELLDLVNPHLGEEQIREVSGQLGEILNQEL